MSFNEQQAKEVEKAVMQVFICPFSKIVGCIDTTEKKVVVFVLNKLLDFDKRSIAQAYSMTYLFVPTVVDEIMDQYILNTELRNKIVEGTKIIGYAFKEMDQGRRAIA